MKKVLSLLLFVSLLLPVFSTIAYSASQEGSDNELSYDPYSILIVTSDNSTNDLIQNNLNSIANIPATTFSLSDCIISSELLMSGTQRNTNIQTNSVDNNGAGDIIKLNLSEEGSLHIDQIIDYLNANPSIESAEKNYAVYVPDVNLENATESITTGASIASTIQNSSIITYNDTYFNEQYSLQKTMANRAWAITTGSNNVKVGILDSGINRLHPDLLNSCSTTLSKNISSDVISPFVDSVGHGTFIAGIIASTANNQKGIAGVCPNVTLVSIKCFSVFGSDFVSDVISGIEYADSINLDIINCSFGFVQSEISLNDISSLRSAIRNFDGLVVAAAGNDGANASRVPAAFSENNLIVVASTTANDTIASTSDYGNTVHLGAPGENIISTANTGGYISGSGTSFAAPFVAATAALIKSVRPNATAVQIKNYILSTVDPLSSLSNKVTTGGRLNIFSAVRTAAGMLMGDINSDNTVTSSDAQTVLRFSIGLETFSQLQKALADVDYDGVVTSSDAQQILRMAVDLAK